MNYLTEIPEKWNNSYKSFGLIQEINAPTRVTATTSSLIDHIYVSSPQYVNKFH